VVSVVLKPKELDALGRCCGRKPVHYKTKSGLRSQPDPHFFCTRCDSTFGTDGKQRPSIMYLAAEGGLTPRYVGPQHTYWHSHEVVSGVAE